LEVRIMPTLNRSLAIPQTEVGVYHCYNRCVQQAHLCGFDAVNNIDYSHRKVWIWQKLKVLTRAFAIDIFKCSLMDNHLHLLLRNRPDLVAEWTDEEVARRWWEVCPERVEPDGSASEPKAVELEQWLSDPERMLELRQRLSSPSWLMQIWCSYIGRRANRESEKTGRFFEERFKSVRLLDEAAILACALYIDLNPIRACCAETPEQSDYTSAQARIQGRKQRLARALAMGLDVDELTEDGGLPLDVICEDPSDADAWLGRLTLDAEQRLSQHMSEWFDGAGELEWENLSNDDSTDEVVESHAHACSANEEADDEVIVPDLSETERDMPQCNESVLQSNEAAASIQLNGQADSASSSDRSRNKRASSGAESHGKRTEARTALSGSLRFPAPRASNKGFVTLTLDAYLELLDWTGRQLHPDKKGAIPADTPPILERLGIKVTGWLELVDKVCQWFGVAIGRVEQLEQEATRVGRNWLWRRSEMAAVYNPT
jgi:hypothetical protein